MISWKRSLLVEHLERLRTDRRAIEDAGHTAPDYVEMAIAEVERELARRDAEMAASHDR